MARVTVEQGTLEGELLELVTGDGKYYSFKGVPYAAPPVGKLRFKAPVSPKPWTGVRDAKKHGSSCPQFDIFTNQVIEGSEDCLYLNVYSPDLSPRSLLPVMVWIHGGGFMCGSGDSSLYGPDFLLQRSILLVTFNYRLGALGFLSLNTEEVPGNAGMKDQVAALRWVQQNIKQFGGDPDNVTIFGESAGGASVAFQLESPMSKGLFRRAIVQSGSSYSSWAKDHQPLEKAIELGKQLGFATQDPTELLECLRGVPSALFIGCKVPTTLKEKDEVSHSLSWNVVEEKDFGGIERFHTAESASSLHDVEIMLGCTAHEGLVFIMDLEKQAEMIDRYLEYTLPKELAWKCSLAEQVEIGRMIKKHYFNGGPVTSANAKRIVDLYSFSQFNFSMVRFLKVFKTRCKSPAYLYRFSCLSERNVMSISLLGAGKRLCGMEGTSTAHADDLMYLFDVPLADLPHDKSAPSYQMIQNTTTLWTNFAKYGNPTPDGSLGVTWSPYSLEQEEYLDIGGNLKSGLRADKEEIEFWDKIYKQYLKE